MRQLNAMDWTALILLLIGGINWGLVGFFEYDLVAAIFGPMSAASRVIYAIVGLAAVYVAVISPALARRAEMRPHRAAHQPA
jgi:uncharacterized protein